MKKYFLLSLLSIAIVLIGFSANAQEVSKDSINVLKQEKKDLEVSKRVNDNKLKLASLENKVKQKTAMVESSALDAQRAATDNQETAENLNNDAQNKKLAKKARKDAQRAERAAKTGRNAVSELEELQSDIKDLKKKIADDEARLGIVTAIAAG
jgi:hypothetical protein